LAARRFAHLGGVEVERGHSIGFNQMRMAKSASAKKISALNALECGQARLDDANEVIGDLVGFKNIG
jgi:hypothetical protein